MKKFFSFIIKQSVAIVLIVVFVYIVHRSNYAFGQTERGKLVLYIRLFGGGVRTVIERKHHGAKVVVRITFHVSYSAYRRKPLPCCVAATFSCLPLGKHLQVFFRAFGSVCIY